MNKNLLIKIENISSGYGSTVIVNNFSFEVEVSKVFNVFFKFWRTSIVLFPVTFRRNPSFPFTTSRLSLLCKVFPSDVSSPVLEISNAVDETEEVANIIRSKS